VIRDVGEAVGGVVLETVGRAIGRTQERRQLAVDLLESDEGYLAVFDAPGALGEDVQVRFEGGTLFVRVDRFREFRDEYEMRFPGRGLTLDGHVDLPSEAAVDPSRADATLKQEGTLHVLVPKVSDEDETADESDDEHATEDTSDDEHATDDADEHETDDADG